jgi:hypothetical protein
MGLMARWLGLVVFGLVSLGLLPGAALADGCSNEQFRTGLSASLPDCRAYEQVTPVEKNGGSVRGDTWIIWDSAPDGNKMAYSSAQSFADARGGATAAQPYVASRGAEGWSSHALLPPEAPNGGEPVVPVSMFSSDLSRFALTIGGFEGHDSPPLVAGEPQENQNLFVGDTNSGSYQLVDLTPPGTAPAPALFKLASPDLKHVVFGESAQLTPEAPSEGENYYEWSDGAVRLLGILPGGEAFVPDAAQAVSMDGSRVVLRASIGGVRKLYLRENGASTVQVDASQGPGSGGGGYFKIASDDLSKIFFVALSESGLTSDTVPGSGGNLYEYDVANGRLTDLTPDARVEINLEEGHSVLGVASDGSYAYFVADGDLASGATAGQENLYVWHEGVIRYISSGQGIIENVHGNNESGVSVTPDGTRLAFESSISLTGYDNADANTGAPDQEVFLYDVVADRLVCVSCNPSGARPVGSSYTTPQEPFLEGDSLAGHNLHYLSADGSRVFFNSFDALVPNDVNGREDVYEYSGGHVYLISTGTSGEDSQFAAASENGDDVFFTTSQQLVSQDRDQLFDLYDARVGGGLPPAAVSAVCAGEGCRAALSTPPALGTPGSLTFAGAGNLAPSVQTPVAPKAKKPKAKKPKVKKAKRKRRRGANGRARRARHVGRGHLTGKRG